SQPPKVAAVLENAKPSSRPTSTSSLKGRHRHFKGLGFSVATERSDGEPMPIGAFSD
ncbi:MAG: hypothetical protein KEFWMYNX_001358, partial [Candidatus Fervidibacter sp.]